MGSLACRGSSQADITTSLALITLITPHYFIAISKSGYVSKQFRRFCSDYGMPITTIAATGLAYWGRFDA